MSNTSPQNYPSLNFEFITKIGNYALGMTLLCYLTGFAITNAYLGSLGVVNLDVLRSRYILTGVLFLLFIGAIAHLLYGFFQDLRGTEHLSDWDLFKKLVFYSFLRIGVTYFAIIALAIFAGIRDFPIEALHASSTMSLSVWFATESIVQLQRAVVFLIAIFSMILLVLGIIIVVNPMDKRENKRVRQLMVEGIRGPTQKDILNFLEFTLIACTIVFLSLLFLSLLDFFMANRSGSSSAATIGLPEPWSRYFIALAMIYIFIATYLMFLSFRHPSRSKQNGDEPLVRTSLLVFAVSVTVMIIVPIYTFGIYPYIPQQIGGGGVLRVEVAVSSEDLKPYFTDTNSETYLIDRASASSFFLLFNKSTQKTRIIEVASTLIQSITYSQPP